MIADVNTRPAEHVERDTFVVGLAELSPQLDQPLEFRDGLSATAGLPQHLRDTITIEGLGTGIVGRDVDLDAGAIGGQCAVQVPRSLLDHAEQRHIACLGLLVARLLVQLERFLEWRDGTGVVLLSTPHVAELGERTAQAAFVANLPVQRHGAIAGGFGLVETLQADQRIDHRDPRLRLDVGTLAAHLGGGRKAGKRTFGLAHAEQGVADIDQVDGLVGSVAEGLVDDQHGLVDGERLRVLIAAEVQPADACERRRLGRGVAQFPRYRERLLLGRQGLVVAPELLLHRSDRLVIDALPAAVTEFAIDRQRFVVGGERRVGLAEALAGLPDARERNTLPGAIVRVATELQRRLYAASAPA